MQSSRKGRGSKKESTVMYILYYSPGTASLAVHWLLNEIEAPRELVLVDFESKQQKSVDYMKLNPNGMVPTLVVDGVPRTECAALLLLLAERHLEAGLAPSPASSARAAYYQWMLHFANTLQPAFRAWFYADEPAGAANTVAAQEQARKRIESIWDRVDAHLHESGQFMIANRLTAVDFLGTMVAQYAKARNRVAKYQSVCSADARNAVIHKDT
jgi:glutathione S-transferase